jgi:hypothetical protein
MGHSPLSGLLLALFLGACAAPSGGVPAQPPEDPGMPAPPADIAPQPYTAAAIRHSHPAGTFTRYRLTADGQPPVEQHTVWVESREDGCTMEGASYGADGAALGPTQRFEARWWELRDHGSFARASTTVTRGELTVAAGTFLADHYTVVDGEQGTRHYWFDCASAGSPLLYTQEVQGREVFRLELLATDRRAL